MTHDAHACHALVAHGCVISIPADGHATSSVVEQDSLAGDLDFDCVVHGGHALDSRVDVFHVHDFASDRVTSCAEPCRVIANGSPFHELAPLNDFSSSDFAIF